MKATITSISRSYIACGEAFAVSVRLSVGSSEKAVSGNVSLVLNLMDAWNGSAFTAGRLLVTQSGVKISRGASKTLDFSAVMPAESIIVDRTGDNGAAGVYPIGFTLMADYADGVHSACITDAAHLLLRRAAPRIGELIFTDSTGGSDHFGAFVQSASRIFAAGAVTLDPLNPTLTARHRLRIDQSGEIVFDQTTSDGAFDIGSLPRGSDAAWIYSVTDSADQTGVLTGTLPVAAYESPAITALSAERYRVTVDDAGASQLVPADDGENVRFTLRAKIAKVNGKNAWTLDISHGDSTRTALSGADGEAIDRENDTTLVEEIIPAAESREFTFTLKDFFAETAARTSVDRAGAFFNIEMNGVAVGMRTNGALNDPAFEVAKDYQARFYGGIRGVTDYSGDEISTGGRWIDGKPVYRRVFSAEASGETTLAENLGCDSIIRIDGTLESADGAVGIGGAASVTGGRLIVRTDSAAVARIILEYTREQDSAVLILVRHNGLGDVAVIERVSGSFEMTRNEDGVNIIDFAGAAAEYSGGKLVLK